MYVKWRYTKGCVKGKRVFWRNWPLQDAILGEKVSESDTAGKVAPGQTHFLRKNKGNCYGLRWQMVYSCMCIFLLERECQATWHSQDARARPGLFNREGAASEHKHTTSVCREGLLGPGGKGAFALEGTYLRTLGTITLSCSPAGIVDGSVVTLSWLGEKEADGSERKRVDLQGNFSWWAGLSASRRLPLEDLQKFLGKIWGGWSGKGDKQRK